MSEEEKKAIELLKNKNTEYYYRFIDVRDAVSTLLNLIDKLQKEIKDWFEIADNILRATNDYGNITIGDIPKYIEKQQEKIEDLKTKLAIETIDNKYNQEERDEETIPRYKIREKIKELEAMSISEDIYYEDVEKMFKELLEDN